MLEASAADSVHLRGPGVHTRNGDSIELRFRVLGSADGQLSCGFDADRHEHARVGIDLASGEISFTTSDWTVPQPVAKVNRTIGSDEPHTLTIEKVEGSGDLIKNADWIVDLGPLAGERGGELVAEGTPEFVASVKKSSTGQYLSDMNGIKPNAKAPGTTKPRKFKSSVNGSIADETTLPDRPASSANGATKSRRNSRRWRRRRRGAATAS